eukprot:6449640-Amphidinium_carterae.1
MPLDAQSARSAAGLAATGTMVVSSSCNSYSVLAPLCFFNGPKGLHIKSQRARAHCRKERGPTVHQGALLGASGRIAGGKYTDAAGGIADIFRCLL